MLLKHLHVTFSKKIAFDAKFMASSGGSQSVALQSHLERWGSTRAS